MLKDFLGEIQGIMDSFPAYRIHVITFDTDAYNPAQYDSENLEDICDYEVKVAVVLTLIVSSST
jgi:hypothetical protein